MGSCPCNAALHVMGIEEEELQRKLQEAKDKPWPQQERRDEEHSYRRWLRNLRAWLNVDEAAVGQRSAKETTDQCSGRAPLKPRAMWRHNIAKRVQARLVELQHRWQLPPRGHCLLDAMRRIPAAFWTGYRTPPLDIIDEDYDSAREALFQWCNEDWRLIYAAICEMSNHGLALWRIRIQDAMVRGDMATISQWFAGANAQGG